jgi:hypothetical protein
MINTNFKIALQGRLSSTNPGITTTPVVLLNGDSSLTKAIHFADNYIKIANTYLDGTGLQSYDKYGNCLILGNVSGDITVNTNTFDEYLTSSDVSDVVCQGVYDFQYPSTMFKIQLTFKYVGSVPKEYNSIGLVYCNNYINENRFQFLVDVAKIKGLNGEDTPVTLVPNTIYTFGYSVSL